MEEEGRRRGHSDAMWELKPAVAGFDDGERGPRAKNAGYL